VCSKEFAAIKPERDPSIVLPSERDMNPLQDDNSMLVFHHEILASSQLITLPTVHFV